MSFVSRSGAPGWICAVTVARARSASASASESMSPGPSTRWSIAAAIRSPLCGSRSGVALDRRQRLVCHELGLEHDAQRLIDRLDLIKDRGDRPLDERHEADGADPHYLPGGRAPLDVAGERPGPHVEHPLVAAKLAVADVEGLVLDQEPDQLAVRRVDDHLARLRVAEARLGIREWPALVEAVQVRAGKPERLPLVEVRPQADVPVGEREHRLRLREHIEVERLLAHRPRRDLEGAVPDHRSSSSARSSTTTSAPCSKSAFAWPTRSTPTTMPKSPARPASTPASASS